MPAFLKLYLLITGIMSLIVMAMPWLVVLGYFFLLVPGLILSLMPTAFLWGLIYAASRWALCFVMPEKAATVAGFALLALIVCLIPQPSILAAKRALKSHHLDDVEAKGLIRPKGHIRIEVNSPGWDNANKGNSKFRPFKCNARCLALLFEPGVESVTVNSFDRLDGPSFEALKNGKSVLDPLAYTYRLVPKAECDGKGLIVEPQDGHFAKTREEGRAQSMEWMQRLSSDVCLIGEAPRADYDMLLRMGDWMSGPWVKDMSFRQPPVEISLAEILRGDGTVLFRKAPIFTRHLSMPFYIGMDGGMENYRFVLARSATIKRAPDWSDSLKAVDAVLDVKRTGDPAVALAAMRTALASTLADPAATADAPAFKSIGDYLATLQQAEATPGDVALIEELIVDPRISELEGAWHLPKILDAAALNRLRPLMARKLLATGPNVRPDRGVFMGAYADWPKGAFATLYPEEETLLDDAVARRRAKGLIRRLSDQKGTAAPRLAAMIESQLERLGGFDRKDRRLPSLERDYGYGAHTGVISAAVDALCVIGPDAAPVLPRLIALERSPYAEKLVDDDWKKMTARLGRPISEIRKPAGLSGTDEKYQKRLAEFLARYREDRGC